MEKIIIGKREAARFLGVTRQAFYNRGEMPPADFESIEGKQAWLPATLEEWNKGFSRGRPKGSKNIQKSA
ncbi:hypothetical protein [Rothia mucilaginosa]|uniref:hypothetical protein n=1 Tax=Rothia mucilaginosa TaxID=43675 RepID=UPI002889A912|nr:hypothetical protein [Rothia mucilaginosa]